MPKDSKNPKNRPPLVSVLFPVYNGAPFLAEAIDSILDQTEKDFELIIINDGSTDESSIIVRSYTDSRIRFYEQNNSGLAATLNRALGLAQGRFLARQDQDDISHPLRFERQVQFLETHANCGMVGTWAKIIGGDADKSRYHRHPTDNGTLQFDLLFNNPFVHSSVMLRSSVFDAVGGYCTDKNRQPPEDYELWSRVARRFEVANIPEVLLIYREVPTSMSRNGLNPFLESLVTISAENLACLLNRPSDNQDLIDIAALTHGGYQRLSKIPNFRRMRRALVAAADLLSERHSCDRDMLRRRALNMFNSIRTRFYITCCRKLLPRFLITVGKLWKFRQ